MKRTLPASDVLLACTLLVLHAWATWGFTGNWAGDNGRWLHEVERFAHGEIPYLDFQWHFPPLGLWLVGGLAHFVGTDLAPISAITAVISAIVIVLGVFYSRCILGRREPFLTAVLVLLALSFAMIGSAPLPMGMYAPSAPIGAALTMGAALLVFRPGATFRPATLAMLGALAGLIVLTKQDFWLAAGFLLALGTWHGVRHRGAIALAAPSLSFAAVVLAGATVVGLTAGWDKPLGIPGGFGIVRAMGGRGLPTWERLTTEVVQVALIVAGVGVVVALLARSRRAMRVVLVAGLIAAAAGAAHMFFTARMVRAEFAAGGDVGEAALAMQHHVRNHLSLFRPTLGWLRHRLGEDSLPAILTPVLVLALLVSWQRPTASQRRVLLLLVFAMLLRVRRGFEYTEWFEFLMTAPILLLVLEECSAAAPARLRQWLPATLAAVLLPLAAIAYHTKGYGPLTRRPYQAYQTTRGTVRWRADRFDEYRVLLGGLDQVDSARTRDLLGFGYSGGFNYFLKRRNPTPFTQDFYRSPVSPDSVLDLLRQHRRSLTLIDLENTRVQPDRHLHLDRWDLAMVPSTYVTFDRPRFDRLAAGCVPVVVEHAPPIRFHLLDCAPADGHEAVFMAHFGGP